MEAYQAIRGPLGPRRGDYHAALTAWAVVASNSRKPRRHKIDQFVLFGDSDRPVLDDDDMLDDDAAGGD